MSLSARQTTATEDDQATDSEGGMLVCPLQTTISGETSDTAMAYSLLNGSGCPLAATMQDRLQFDIIYTAHEIPPIASRNVALCIYRVAQEALRNLVKYAAVTECQVTLAVVGRELELIVRDEGVGFDLASERSEAGIGLESMAERARLVGGRLSVTSAPGQGTTVVFRGPLDECNS